MRLPFAGLQQLLQPLLAQLETLSPPQRAALEAAFGLVDSAAPDRFLIALATLDLLVEAAQSAPLLLIVDDAHWMDRPTCDALAFVARRVQLDPVVLILTIREGAENPFATADVPELPVGPLDQDSAGHLLDARTPGLVPAVRESLLRAAEGNPLALVELPVALGKERLTGLSLRADRMPLTTRLERAFAIRFTALPAWTRRLLVVAAANDTGNLSETLRAGALLAGEPVALAALSPNEEVAAHLEDSAARAHRRGAVLAAVASLERSAGLSGEPSRRGERLLRAAELAFELGRRDIVARLLREAGRGPGPPVPGADALFLAGLRADLADWPFARARLQLAYGAWLRRRRRISEHAGRCAARRRHHRGRDRG